MRYFIGTDISGHKYLVPVEKYREWNEWYETWLTALDDDYPDLDEEFDGAIRLDGGTLTFENPKIESLL